MIRVEKSETEKGYFFKIITENGVFTISFEGVLDLFWNYVSPDIINENKKTFIITKENYQFYKLIENLFNDIKNNEELEKYSSEKLFKNNKVEWHSDDYTDEESAILEIEYLNEEVYITFTKGRTDIRKYVFSIRICNSGSRYNFFNQFFMNMYNELIDFDEIQREPDCEIEEDEMEK